MKTLIGIAVLLPLAYLLLMYSPTSIDFNPTGYFIPFGSFDGPLEENYELNKAERLYTDILKGPESIVFHEGALYTGLKDGRIVRVKKDKVETVSKTGRQCVMPYEEHQCGRPLGLRVGKDGLLYVIDAYYGIFTMNFTTGDLTRIVPSYILVEGEHLNFPDDLDIDDEGNIYFSDASKKWDLSKVYYLISEYESSGRVIRYNIHSRKADVLVRNLYFPNGIQLSHNKKSLLIAEFLNRRIMRYHLKGSKKGKLDVFIDNLPGEPDNIRASPRGYWVALTSARNSSNYLFVDSLNKYPEAKKVIMKFHSAVGTLLCSLAEMIGNSQLKKLAYEYKRLDTILSTIRQKHGIVIELDEAGNIIRSLQSPDGMFHTFSEAKEHNGFLYLGSFAHDYLVRLKL